jgi:4-hydroxybenzoate polyprenyltransferase
MKSCRHKVFRGWLELFRPPNLFTLPGDIIAGVFLAGFSPEKSILIIPVILISLLLYCAGLLLNDYFDREKDRSERPARPIPSGRVKPVWVLIAAVALILVALTAGFFVGDRVFKIALIITLLIISYNSFARKIPAIGFFVMGLCRGFNLILGAGIGISILNFRVIGAAGVETIYILVLTAIAYNEVKNEKTGLVEKLIKGLIILQLFFLAVSLFVNMQYILYYIPVVLLLFLCFYFSVLVSKKFYGS